MMKLVMKQRQAKSVQRQQIIDELRLVQQLNNGVSKNSKLVRQ